MVTKSKTDVFIHQTFWVFSDDHYCGIGTYLLLQELYIE